MLLKNTCDSESENKKTITADKILKIMGIFKEILIKEQACDLLFFEINSGTSLRQLVVRPKPVNIAQNEVIMEKTATELNSIFENTLVIITK